MQEIPLRDRHGQVLSWAKVDTQDFNAVSQFRWHRVKSHGKTFYAQRSWRGADGQKHHQYMHQLITRRRVGIDHVDRNGLNNCRYNLRAADPSQQAANRGMRSNNTSGVPGVDWHGVRDKWRARVSYRGKLVWEEHFDSLEMAASVRSVVAREAFGDFYSSQQAVI